MARESILIVEDESVVALNVAHIVESLGYRAIGPIPTGLAALRLLEQETVDLVLMDVKLKGKMDGIELAQRINEIRPVPIVFLTAYTDNRTLSRAKVAEPYGYITKSFDEGELHSTIEMALYKFKMEQKVVKDERLLSATLDSILEGVVTTDHDGRVRYMNPAAVKLLAVTFDAAEGKVLDELVVLGGAADGAVRPSELVADDGPGASDDVAPPLMLHSGGGRATPVEWKAVRIGTRESGQAETVHVVRDLTARLRAEVAQRRLVSLVEVSDDAIITASPDATIESWNSGATKIFGYPASEAVGRKLSLLTREAVPFDLMEIVLRTVSGQSVEPFELVCLRRDGSAVDIAMKVQGIRDLRGGFGSVSLIARDVTARKNLDKKVREMLNREQTRIGQDLHDSIGQSITGVLFKAKVLEHQLRERSLVEQTAGISEIEELLTDALLKLRELARGLIPATIVSDGLAFAVRRLAKDTESLCGVPIEFRADSGFEVSDDLISSELYHIVEEALNNAVKHSLCGKIVVRLSGRPEGIVVSVGDDGRGIDERRDQSGGLGLKIMHHRAELIGASLSVESDGSGTTVVCRLPAVRPSKGAGDENAANRHHR